MIITLKDTTASAVASRLDRVREESGSLTMGRVLTLLVVVSDMIDVGRAIQISSAASREHPCRVIVVVESDASVEKARLNAQIRVGDEEGPSEVIVLEPLGGAAEDLDTLVMPLVLADTPVVAFWPDTPPDNPGEHPLGVIAVRRITDSRETDCPMRTLMDLADVYHPGDSDLAWSGITLWRRFIATTVDQFTHKPTSIVVKGNRTHPSSYLIAAWLTAVCGIEAKVEVDENADTVDGVFFRFRDKSEISLTRHTGSSVAHLHLPDRETAYVNLARRPVEDCLMEELRRLDADTFYERILTKELPALKSTQHLLETAGAR